ncbi:MAG: protein-glutamate O-methyltransferase CheR [Anaerolineae bacterium]
MIGNAEEEDFLALLDKIRYDTGFDVRQYKSSFIKRRLAIRLRARGSNSYRGYMRFLDDDPDEYRYLLDCLTINLSCFFRDEAAFKAVRDVVLAPLIRAKRERRERQIRVWSAGCAKGEEAYSVAILLHELLGSAINDWSIDIRGTDCDARALARARRGIYEDFSLRGVDEAYVRGYFLRDQGYEVKPEIKALVKFEQHDLITDPPPQRLDLILCRNVLFYFSREQQERLLRCFHTALNKGGYLVIGRTEILLPTVSRLFLPADPREHIYIKRQIVRTKVRC